MNTTAPATRKYVDTKVRDMVAGQHVTVPTLHSTFTGDLLHVEEHGDRTRRLTIGQWDGTVTTITTSSDYTGSVRDLEANPYPGNNAAEVQVIWDDEVVATVTPTPSNDYSDARAARADYEGMIDEEDGYLIRLVIHGVTVAEHQNPAGDDDEAPIAHDCARDGHGWPCTAVAAARAARAATPTLTPELTPADRIDAALLDLRAACRAYRYGPRDSAPLLVKAAEDHMHAAGVTAELTGQAQHVRSQLGPYYPLRASDVCMSIAGTLERLYSTVEDNDDEVAASVAAHEVAMHEDGTGREDRAMDADEYAAYWGDNDR